MTHDKRQWLDISPDVRVELVLQEERLLGIGNVHVCDVPIRSDATVLRPDFSTIDAVYYQDFVLDEVVREDSATVLRGKALGRPGVYGTVMDEYDYTQVFPRVRGVQPDAFDWILTPEELELDGQRYVGFSLGFRFESSSNEIHRLTTVATWEIGGKATGNSLYQQSFGCPQVYSVADDTHFTTAILKRLDRWQDWKGMSYQLAPRWGEMQPFDFQAAPQGVLFSYWKDPHSVKSLVQKNPGEEVVFVVDEYDFALTGSVTTPAKHILFSPSPDPSTGRPQHEVIDMWTRAMDHSSGIIRGFFGIQPSRPQPHLDSGGEPLFPEGSKVYVRTAAEVADGPKDDWMWRVEDDKFYFIFRGEKVESHDVQYWMADNVLPELHEKGLTRVSSWWVGQSDFTELCFMNHAQKGWHGDLTVSSVCGVQRFAPSEFYGGWRGWRYFADRARSYGIRIGSWIGMHISPRSPAVLENPDYVIMHANTLAHGGGYGINAINSINWCSGAKQWFLDDMKRWHDEGLDWIWFDSWPNMTTLPLNYGGRMEPMQWEGSTVLGELQKIGYSWFGFEGITPFGVHACGLHDPMVDYAHHVYAGVVGQSDLANYIGREYMGYDQAMMAVPNPRRDPAILRELSFRFCANRSLTLVNEADSQTYVALLPLMEKRFMLPDDRGVRWESTDGSQVLFAYREFAFPVDADAQVTRVKGASETPVSLSGGTLTTEPFTAYRIARK